ncbi:MAG TPA: hypothetical protein VK778_07950 [Solirubrobacteraceae bacterium]|jgi:hypothetical protein|nr:hypothetical protein [Solirubrobacteraceae bacterium]
MTTSRPRTLFAVPLALLLLGFAIVLSCTSTAAAAAPPRPLMSAARASTQADRALVTDAKRLKRCLIANSAHPVRCEHARRALQRAGAKLANTELRLSRIVRATDRAAAPATARSASSSQSAQQAPRLSVSGQTLTWTRVANVTTYVLARSVPGQANQYSVIRGTSTTPPPVPGATVTYSVRTTTVGSAWSTQLSISYPATPVKTPTPSEPVTTPVPSEPVTTPVPSEPVKPPAQETAPNPQAAPDLSVTGQTLSWNASAGVSTYVFVIKAPGQADKYSEISGTSITPPAVAGATVKYSIRTAVEGSAWAPEASISYPAVATPPASSEPPAPKEAPAQSSTTFQPGMNSGSDALYDLPGAEQLGAKIVRIDVGIEDTVAQLEPIVGAYAEQGIRVAPMADFNGGMPTPAEAQNLASWASAFGPGGSFWAKHAGGQFAMQTIEFGNETSYSYQYSNDTSAGYASRAQSYALRFAEAAEAVKAVNSKVGLLAQGDAGNAGSLWVENMFKAVPDLASLVAGWTIHPYGTDWRSRLETLVAQTAAQGAPASIPIDITEWGLSTDNGRCLTENYGWNACMTYQEASEVLTRTVSEMRQLLGGRLGMFLLFQIRDQQPSGTSNQREGYFGALQNGLQAKGAYTTAVQSLLAS